MILKVLAYKNGKSTLTLMGSKTNENLVTYDIEKADFCSTTKYFDKPQPGDYNMVDPHFS